MISFLETLIYLGIGIAFNFWGKMCVHLQNGSCALLLLRKYGPFQAVNKQNENFCAIR